MSYDFDMGYGGFPDDGFGGIFGQDDDTSNDGSDPSGVNDAVSGAVSGAVDTAQGVVSGAVNTAQGIVSGAVSGAVNTAQGVVSGAINQGISNLPGPLQGAAQQAAGSLGLGGGSGLGIVQNPILAGIMAPLVSAGVSIPGITSSLATPAGAPVKPAAPAAPQRIIKLNLGSAAATPTTAPSPISQTAPSAAALANQTPVNQSTTLGGFPGEAVALPIVLGLGLALGGWFVAAGTVATQVIGAVVGGIAGAGTGYVIAKVAP